MNTQKITSEILARIHNYLSHEDIRTIDVNGIKIANLASVEKQADIKTSALLDEAFSTVEKKMSLYELKIKNLNQKIALLKEENQTLKKNIKEFDNTYGKHISPFTIINELYTGTKLPYMILRKREEFQIKISVKQFKYWTGILMDLKIIRRIDKGRFQSNVSDDEAHDILYQNDYAWNGEPSEK